MLRIDMRAFRCRHTPAPLRSRWLRAPSVLMAVRMAVLMVSRVGAQTADDDNVLRVYGNMTTIELAPVLVAIDQKLFPGEATITNGGIPNLYGVASSNELFEAGQAPLATNAETQALRYSVDNPDLRIILTVSEGLYRIVAKRSAGIATLRDLRGKRIGTIPNTSSNYFLHRMLQSVGMSIDDVRAERVFPLTDYASALTTGGFDAVTVWEPGAEYAAAAIGSDAIEFHEPKVYRELFNLNTRAEHLANPAMRARIVEFVRALIRASEIVNRTPEVAWPLVSAASGLDEGLVASVWRHHAYPAKLVDDLLDVLEAEDVWVARETGRVPRTRAQLAPLIDASVLEEALAGMSR